MFANHVLKQIAKALACSAFVVAGTFSASAYAFLDFTIQESGIPGSAANLFTADQINGNYTERVTFTGPNTFATAATFGVGGFFNNGSPVSPTQLNGLEPGGYKLYASFFASGTFNTVGTVTTFTGLTGSINLFADPLSNSTATPGTTAFDPIVVAGGGDDYSLGSTTSLTAGQGRFDSSTLNNGDFELIFDNFVLTGPPGGGDAFFIAPRPFYFIVDINGNFTQFPVAVGTTATTTGSANAFFVAAVPEPGSVALFGLALAAMGWVGVGGRRRNG